MNKRKESLGLVAASLFLLLLAVGSVKLQKQVPSTPPPPVPKIEPMPQVEAPKVPKTPATPNISASVPVFLQYPAVVEQIKKWNMEAPELTEVKTYGKSRQGKDLHYIRVTNKYRTEAKPVVLIHGCIHGNEPHAAGCVMAYIGTILSNYGKDPEVTKLLDTRDIYFVPVMSADSYPHSRHVDGVDPNRDYPGPARPNHQSTPGVKAMQDLFMTIKPKAVISAHTFGRIMLYPYGDDKKQSPNAPDFQRVVGKMSQMCQYKMDRACNMYSRPIQGSELDWYYRHGAFPIVMEVGTHQRPPSPQEIKSEFERTYKGVLYFIQEAPLVQIKTQVNTRRLMLAK